MFIGAFDPVIYKSLSLLRIELGLFLLLNILSVFLLLKSFLKPSITNSKTLLYTLLFYTILLNSIPDVFEFLYWYPSVTAYQLGLSLLLIFVANIFFESKKRISKNQYLIYNSLIIIIIIGLLELFIIPIGISIIIKIISNYYKKESIKKDLFLLGLTGLFSAIMIAGPGNYERVIVENPTGVIIGFYLAFKSLIYLLGYLFQNPTFLLGNVLFLSISFNAIYKNNTFIFKIPKINPLYSLLFSLAVSYLIFLPSTLALTSLPAGRIFDLASFIFTILWLFGLLVFINYYKAHFSFELPRVYQIIIASSMLMFVFSGIYITNPYEFAQKKKGSVLIYGNILNAYHTLFYEAKPFNEDMIRRYKNFRLAEENKEKTLVVKPLNHHPEMLIFVDISDIQSPGTWIFNWEAKYYGMDSIRIEKQDTTIEEKIKVEIEENLYRNTQTQN
jgi:hypothetical protein